MSDVIVRIQGQDAASPVFRAVGASATAMGQSVETSSSRSAAAFDALKAHAALLGSLLGGTLVNSLQAFAEAGQKEEAAQRQLEAAITNTGASYSTYADQIKKAEGSAANFGVTNDQAAGALQTLTTTTGSTSAALSLLQVTMDIAAARHIDLSSAATLVGKAYDGDTAALKRYGVVLAAGATGAEAITAIQEKFAGQAAAGTTTLSRFTAEFDDWKSSMGEALGPLSGIISILPSLNAGQQIATAAGGALVDAWRAQKAAATEAATALETHTAVVEADAAATEAAEVAEGGFSLGLLGPIGIVAGLAAAAAGFLLLKGHTDDYRSSADAAATDTAKLSSAIAALQAGGGSPTAVATLKAVSDEWTALDVAAAKYQETLTLSQQPLAQSTDPNQPMFKGTQTAAYNAPILAAQNAIAALDKLAAISKKDEDSITANISNIFAHPGIDQGEAQAAIDALFTSFKNGTIDADGLAKGVTDLNKNWSDYAVQTASASAATNALTAQITKLQDSLSADLLNQALSGLDTKPIQDVIDLIGASTDKAAAGFATGITTILSGVADGSIKAADAYKDIISLGGQFNTILSNEAAAADVAAAAITSQGQAAENAATAQYGWADSYVAVYQAKQQLDAAIKEGSAATALDEQQATMFGPDSVGAEGSAAAATKITTAVNKVTDAYNEMGVASIANGAEGSQAFAAQAAAADAATSAIKGYLTALGVAPSLLDALAIRQNQGQDLQPPLALPAYDQQTLTSLINVRGLYGQIDDALKAGTITQDQYNLAQQTFDAIAGHTGETAKNLVGDLINVSGQYGVIDQLLKQGAITQQQWNDLQQVGTDVLNQRLQVNFSVIDGMQTSTAVLGDLTRVVITNTDAIAQSSDTLKKWADTLIGPVGTIAEVDTLLAHHKITLDEYNKAQQAQISISQTDAKVQEDVQTIQAKQAPLLAQLADGQEKYLAQISGLPAAQQLAALGFMDSTESMKAQTLVSLAASAAMGQLGDSGKESATKIIQGAAESDPALQEMLKSMGLITVGAHGEVTVNFSNGDSIQALLTSINTDLDQMITLLGGVPADTKINVDATSAIADIGSVNDALAGIPPQVSTTITTYTQNVDLGSTSAASGVAGVGGASIGITAMSLGGTVMPPSGAVRYYTTPPPQMSPLPMPRMAGGGTMTLVGEYGPELVQLSRGDQVTNAAATRSRLRSGGSNITVINQRGQFFVTPASGNDAWTNARSNIAASRRVG